MLSCRLEAANLAGLWERRQTGWLSGPNYIRPFVHPRLECFSLRTRDKFLIANRERLKGAPPRPSNERANSTSELDEHTFAEAIRAIRDWPLDFILLLITDTTATPEFELSCGAWGSAPVYLVQQGATLWAHWDPAALYPYLECDFLDEIRAVHFLARCGCPYSKDTLFPGMQTLTERARATWSATRRLSIQYPEPAPVPRPRRVKADSDVIGTFGEIISASMGRWIDPNSEAAAEFSGGLDTSIVAAVASRLSGSPVRTYGLIMPDELGQLQGERRRELVRLFDFADFSIDAAAWLPLSDRNSRIRNHCFVPWHEFYYEAFEKLLRQAVQDNVDLLFSGNGGDELFYLHPQERSPEQRASRQEDLLPQRRDLPVFLTNRTFECYRETVLSVDRAPRARMPRSALSSSASISTLYLSLGLWPVSPFATPELAWFCGSLPREWRENRRLQREFLASLGCSRKVTHPEKTETFVPVLELSLRSAARPLLEQLFRESRLAQRGFVDGKYLLSAYGDYCKTGGREGEDLEEAFLSVAVLELAVRSLETTRSSRPICAI
jgi:asparagine synthase (glutamine-hydrolysing)